MIQMGAQNYMVADALIGVVAQRLCEKHMFLYCKGYYFSDKRGVGDDLKGF